jgi:hypothetical protein
MNKIILSLMISLSFSSPAWASEASDCMARLTATFESVTPQRLPEVLKQFFAVQMARNKAENLIWTGSLVASWDHPTRESWTESQAASSVQAILFNQTELDGSSTFGIELRGIRAYGRFKFAVDNSKESPLGTEALTVHYSPTAKMLVFIQRKSPTNYQSIQFTKGDAGNMALIEDHTETTFPNNSQYIEKATLTVAP